MVKKLQKMAEKKAAAPSGLLDSQLAQTVKDSAHQIWLAGLGAFAKAQGGGSKVFDALIKEGSSLQRKTQAVAEERIGDVAGRMSAMAGQVGEKANAQWDKLESIFEQRTARALGKLGVPTARDVAALGARVDALAAAVAAQGGQVPAPGGAAARPARKSAGAAARKSAARTAAAEPAPPAAEAAAPAAEAAAAKPARKSAPRAARKTAAKTAGKAALKSGS